MTKIALLKHMLTFLARCKLGHAELTWQAGGHQQHQAGPREAAAARAPSPIPPQVDKWGTKARVPCPTGAETSCSCKWRRRQQQTCTDEREGAYCSVALWASSAATPDRSEEWRREAFKP